MKLKQLAVATAMSAATLGAGSAQAVPVALELALLVDVSGSVNATEYNLQKTGYVNAFNNATIQSAISALTGGIAVTYIEWSGSSEQSVRVNWTHVYDAATAGAFATAIENTTRASGGLTAPGSAINFATPLFSNNGFEGARWVIDVSGDGSQNAGAVTATARDSFLNTVAPTGEGLTKVINGLAILNDEPTLDVWYANNVIGGPGAFVVSASNFQDFERAVVTKIGREINPTPEPGMLGLLGIGLLGLVYMRRKTA